MEQLTIKLVRHDDYHAGYEGYGPLYKKLYELLNRGCESYEDEYCNQWKKWYRIFTITEDFEIVVRMKVPEYYEDPYYNLRGKQ